MSIWIFLTKVQAKQETSLDVLSWLYVNANMHASLWTDDANSTKSSAKSRDAVLRFPRPQLCLEMLSINITNRSKDRGKHGSSAWCGGKICVSLRAWELCSQRPLEGSPLKQLVSASGLMLAGPWPLGEPSCSWTTTSRDGPLQAWFGTRAGAKMVQRT